MGRVLSTGESLVGELISMSKRDDYLYNAAQALELANRASAWTTNLIWLIWPKSGLTSLIELSISPRTPSTELRSIR